GGRPGIADGPDVAPIAPVHGGAQQGGAGLVLRTLHNRSPAPGSSPLRPWASFWFELRVHSSSSQLRVKAALLTRADWGGRAAASGGPASEGRAPTSGSACAALDDAEHGVWAGVCGKGVKRCLVGQRPLEPVMKLVALDLDGAELPQVIGDELRIKQREAATD